MITKKRSAPAPTAAVVISSAHSHNHHDDTIDDDDELPETDTQTKKIKTMSALPSSSCSSSTNLAPSHPSESSSNSNKKLTPIERTQLTANWPHSVVDQLDAAAWWSLADIYRYATQRLPWQSTVAVIQPYHSFIIVTRSLLFCFLFLGV
jgi:hypothetical protein